MVKTENEYHSVAVDFAARLLQVADVLWKLHWQCDWLRLSVPVGNVECRCLSHVSTIGTD